MTKKVKILKLFSLTLFSMSLILGFFIKPFKIILPNKDTVKVSIFDSLFIDKFQSVRSFLLVLLVITFIIFIMLSICLIGELTTREQNKVIKAFGYNLESKDIRQISYILLGLLVASFIVHGTTFDGNTLVEYKLSCFTTTYLILLILGIVMIVICHLGISFKNKGKNNIESYLNGK